MSEPRTTTPVTEEPPLKRLWTNLRAKNKDFTVEYDDFEADMQDEDNLRSLHGNLAKAIDGFSVPYDQFAQDMGLSKKKAQPVGGQDSGAGLQNSKGTSPNAKKEVAGNNTQGTGSLPPPPLDNILRSALNPLGEIKPAPRVWRDPANHPPDVVNAINSRRLAERIAKEENDERYHRARSAQAPASNNLGEQVMPSEQAEYTEERFAKDAEDIRSSTEKELRRIYGRHDIDVQLRDGDHFNVDKVRRRSMEDQLRYQEQGWSRTKLGLHNIGRASDYTILVGGKAVEDTAMYQVLGGEAKKRNLFWGWDWDKGHIGEVDNVTNLLEKHPELANDPIIKQYYHKPAPGKTDHLLSAILAGALPDGAQKQITPMNSLVPDFVGAGAALNTGKQLPADFTGPMEAGSYIKPSDAGTVAEGTSYVDPEQRRQANDLDAKQQQQEIEYQKLNSLGLGGLSDFLGSFANAVVPGTARAVAATVDYLDNLTAYAGLQGQEERGLAVANLRGKNESTQGLRDFAKEYTSYVSPEAQQELKKDWTNGRAWAAALGSGSGSLATIAVAGATTGGVGALVTGSAMALDETEQAADAAGLTTGEKIAMQSVVAPVVGLLEEAGLGALVKNPLTRRLIGTSIVAGAAGKLERTALVRAASEFAPKLVEVAARAGKQALSEGATEGAQTLVSEAYKLAFDEAKGNEGKPQGNGSFGSLEDGLAAGVKDALLSAGQDAAVGTALGGIVGGAAKTTTQPAAQQPQYVVPADVSPEEQQAAQQAYPEPVRIVRPTGQVEFSNAQVVSLSPDRTMARIVSQDAQGQPVDTTVPAEYIQSTTPENEEVQTASVPNEGRPDTDASAEVDSQEIQPENPELIAEDRASTEQVSTSSTLPTESSASPDTPASTDALPQVANGTTSTEEATQQRRKTADSVDASAKFSDELKAGLNDGQRDRYTPKSLPQTVDEVNDYLANTDPNEAMVAALANDDSMSGDVRAGLRVALMEGFDKQSAELLAAGDEQGAREAAQKAIQVGDAFYEAGTEMGRAINAYKLIATAPHAQIFRLSNEVSQQAKAVRAKAEESGKVVAAEARSVQADVAKEAIASARIQQLTKDLEDARKRIAKLEATQGEIKAVRQRRGELLTRLKKLNGQVGIIDPAQERAELHVEIFKSYIQEGVLQVKALVERFRADTQDSPDKATDDELTQRAEQAVAAEQQRNAERTVRQGLRESGATIEQIVLQHITEQDEQGRTLAERFAQEAGLTDQEATQYADALEKEFKRLLDKKRESVLNRMYSMRARVGLGRKGKTALDKTLETLNLSPVDDSRVIGLVAEQTELPEITPQQLAKLRGLADNVQTAKEGRDKEKAVREYSLEISRIKGVKLLDLAQAAWYSNILSSYMTHLVNFTANSYQVTMETLIATGNVAMQGGKVSAPVRGLASGLRSGARTAQEVLATGYEPSNQAGKYDIPNTLEVAASQGNRLANVLKYVPRLLKASDVFYQQGLREMRAWELASLEAAKEGRSDPSRKTWEAVYEKLANTTQRHSDAAAQAQAEGRTGRDAALRVWELMEQSRGVDMQENARVYATRAVFNGEMEGTLGVIFTGVTGTVKKLGPVASYVIPFAKIITNVANAYLDYTFVGAIRAAKGAAGFERYGSQYRPYTPQERAKVLAKSMLGASVMAALYAATHREDDKDSLEISGSGPRDAKLRDQLQQNGWRPYAVRFGDSWVSYKETPLFFVIGAIGSLKDYEKYEKGDPTSDDYLDKGSLMMMRTLAMTVETTATKNLSDALDALTSTGGYQGQAGADKFKRYLERTVGYSATGYVPLSGLVRQISRDWQAATDMDKKEAKRAWEVVQQDLPVFREGLRDAIDALGDPIKVKTDRLQSSKPNHRDKETQELWDTLTEKGVSIPVPNQRTMVVMTFQGQKQHAVDFQNPANWKEGPPTDEVFYDYLKIRGGMMKEVLLANLDGLKKADREEARKMMESISRQVNEQAKKQLISTHLGIRIRIGQKVYGQQ